MLINKRLQAISIRGLAFMLPLVFSACSKGPETAAKSPQVVQEAAVLYTCGMHPHVLHEGPGNCPICGMDLVPIMQTAAVSAVSAPTQSGGERKIIYWRAPMDPSYISPVPGKSPMGMDLVPVYEGEEAFGATVRIDPVVVQNMGVRTAPAERRDLFQTIRTIGRIDYDEARVAHIHTKFSGWIEKTFVNTTGQQVKRNEALLEIYSPQLVTAQEEYLDATQSLMRLGENASAAVRSNLEGIIASARRRLENFDVSQAQIQELIRTGKVTKTITLNTPFPGVVIKKHALDGMEVRSGMNLYTIADLDQIWVYADIYEYEVPWLEAGQKVSMTLSYNPGKVYLGEVQYIYPYLEEKTRTIKVRMSFPNPRLELKPGMYANVEIQTSPVRNAIAVPAEAVLFSGQRNLVMVALGGGRFVPRTVTLGIESGDGYYQILKGLSAGEEVVTSGQFLIDSESKLQESIAKMLGVIAPPAGDSGKMDMPMSPADTAGADGEMKMNPDPPGVQHDQHQDHNLEGETMLSAAIPFGSLANGNLTYYTCPMESHSYVKMDAEGNCPDCGMNLMQKTMSYEADQQYHTCPTESHAHVVTEAPGACPVCGKALIESSV